MAQTTLLHPTQTVPSSTNHSRTVLVSTTAPSTALLLVLSAMGNLFGKPRKRPSASPPSSASTFTTSASSLSDHDRAILELKRQKDRLHRYTLQLDTLSQREADTAKQLIRDGKKERAKLVLQRRRYQLSMRDKAESQLLNVEQLTSAIEWAAVSQKVFHALQEGNAVLQRLNAETSVEAVERLMEDTTEAVEEQQRVSELLGGQLTEVEEAEVEAEVRAMEEDERRWLGETDADRQQLEAIKALPDIPARPVEAPAAQQQPTLPARPPPRKAAQREELVMT